MGGAAGDWRQNAARGPDLARDDSYKLARPVGREHQPALRRNLSLYIDKMGKFSVIML
jgi:hypothetical protein